MPNACCETLRKAQLPSALAGHTSSLNFVAQRLPVLIYILFIGCRRRCWRRNRRDRRLLFDISFYTSLFLYLVGVLACFLFVRFRHFLHGNLLRIQ